MVMADGTKTIDKKKKSNYYFGEKEEKAVRRLVTEDLNWKEYNKIYIEELHEPFKKMAESILKRYGMQYDLFKIGMSLDDLITAGVSFMFLKIKRFNVDKKSKNGQAVKAFSFFGTIVKRYYIQLSIKGKKSLHRSVDLDDEESWLSKVERDEYKKDSINDDWAIFAQLSIKWFESHFNNVFTTTDEIIVANAVLKLFKTPKLLDRYNKKYIYLLLREMTGFDSKKITPVLNKMRDKYNILKRNYVTNGKIYSGSLSYIRH